MKTNVIKSFNSFVKLYFEQFFEWHSVIESASQHIKHIEHSHVEMVVTFGESNKAACGYDIVDLYSNSVSRVPPKAFDVMVLFHPLDKQLHLPTYFKKHFNIFRIDIDQIDNIHKSMAELFGIVHDYA